MRENSTVTLKDIAGELGVSSTLVSVCLSGRYKSGSYRISEATAQKVRDCALRMGYVGNTGARQLRSGGVAPVGLLLSQNSGEAKSMAAINHALDVLTQAGRETLLIGFRDLVKAVKQLKGAGVRDFILLGPISESADSPADRKIIAELQPLLQGMRCFAVDYNFGLPGETFALDMFRFGIDRSKLLKELLDAYRRCGKSVFISIDWYPVKELLKQNYFISEDFICPLCAPDGTASPEQIGCALAEKYLRLSKKHHIDMIFASDMAAGCLIAELLEKNIRIPEDVEVIGFDNLQASKWFQVPLTSFGAPVTEHVQLAIDHILGRKEARKTVISPPQLEWRKSTRLPEKGIKIFTENLLTK